MKVLLLLLLSIVATVSLACGSNTTRESSSPAVSPSSASTSVGTESAAGGQVVGFPESAVEVEFGVRTAAYRTVLFWRQTPSVRRIDAVSYDLAGTAPSGGAFVYDSGFATAGNAPSTSYLCLWNSRESQQLPPTASCTEGWGGRSTASWVKQLTTANVKEQLPDRVIAGHDSSCYKAKNFAFYADFSNLTVCVSKADGVPLYLYDHVATEYEAVAVRPIPGANLQPEVGPGNDDVASSSALHLPDSVELQ